LLDFSSGDYTQLVVTDNGCGMDMSIREKIFDLSLLQKKSRDLALVCLKRMGSQNDLEAQ
jgi:sensor histidine kinase regulating citrate/malate metabolism